MCRCRLYASILLGRFYVVTVVAGLLINSWLILFILLVICALFGRASAVEDDHEVLALLRELSKADGAFFFAVFVGAAFTFLVLLFPGCEVLLDLR